MAERSLVNERLPANSSEGEASRQTLQDLKAVRIKNHGQLNPQPENHVI